jgi:uncharacterized BrkB/YihY/UPF0761 family membrane protein
MGMEDKMMEDATPNVADDKNKDGNFTSSNASGCAITLILVLSIVVWLILANIMSNVVTGRYSELISVVLPTGLLLALNILLYRFLENCKAKTRRTIIIMAACTVGMILLITFAQLVSLSTGGM